MNYDTVHVKEILEHDFEIVHRFVPRHKFLTRFRIIPFYVTIC